MNLILVSGFLLLATLCTAQNRPAPKPVSYPEDDKSINRHFQSYKLRHGKKYRNSAHEAYKKTVFKAKVQEINRHNRLFRQGKVKYTKDVNFFTDLEDHELKNYFGHVDRKIKRSVASLRQAAVQNVTLMPTFDWRNLNKVSPVKNQGGCGTCWIFAGVSALESQYAINYNISVPNLSEQNIVDCQENWPANSTGTCSPGGQPNWVWQYASLQNGLFLGTDYPYTGRYSGRCPNRTVFNPVPSINGTSVMVSTVFLPQNDETSMAQAIQTLGPITVTLHACSSFMSYSGGVFDDPTCIQPVNPHAVVLTGYGTFNGSDYFVLRNSWSAGWGQNGYMYIARNKNTCNLASNPQIPQLTNTVTRLVCVFWNETITCGTGTIRIQSVSYGRTDNPFCTQLSSEPVVTNCTSDRTSVVANQCNGLKSCNIFAKSSLYLPDPCPQVYTKFLTVNYQCVIS